MHLLIDQRTFMVKKVIKIVVNRRYYDLINVHFLAINISKLFGFW